MAQEKVGGSFVQKLTKPKGAMLAVPAIVAAALVISVFAGGETSVARDTQKLQPSAQAPSKPTSSLANEATNPQIEKPIQLAAADNPSSQSFTAAQEKDIGAIVRRYLLKNPELLVEISAELERRRTETQEKNQAKVLIDEKKSIFRSPYDYVLGNREGDITVIEYFDYNCGWCKRALPEISKLTASDKKVRVVMKEFPIFGPDSTFAAKAAMASVKQDKYWVFHTALMKADKVTEANTFDIAKSVGVDVAALKLEMAKPEYDKALAENARIAQALGMQGTPGFIVDSRVNYGYVPADGLTKMLAEIRKEGCKIC